MQSLTKSHVAAFIVEIDKLILKFTWKYKGLRIANIILKNKNKVGGFTLSNLKTYYKITIIKNMW